MGDPEGRGILELLEAPEVDRGVVLHARAFGEAGCAALLSALSDPNRSLDDERRARAVHLLGELECRGLTDQVPDLLDDPAPSVRFALVYALPKVDCKRGRQVLLKLLGDAGAEAGTQVHAAHALWLEENEELRLTVRQWAERLVDLQLKASVAQTLDLDLDFGRNADCD